MALFIADDPELTDQQHIDFQEHIEECCECAKEFEESTLAIELAKQYWIISNETAAPTEKASQSYRPEMTVEEGWRDLCRRCPSLAENIEKPKRIQLFLGGGAVAVCLVIGVLAWMIFSNHLKPLPLSPYNPFQQVAFAPEPSVRIELVTNAGNISIASEQQITSGNRLKTLLINSRHHLVMSANTILAVEPLVENSNIGCLVELASGRIYTHVEHDGDPFVVHTAHGQAVITGTIFDIETTEKSTALVVSEGTVRFESEKGTVNVPAGQMSKIIGQSAPSIPLSCNTIELTAWATYRKLNIALDQAKSDADGSHLALSLREDPIVLTETAYNHWMEKKRDWFVKHFPWILELKDALTREGINVDYPELLIKSGDVWQFVCLQESPTRFSVPDLESLLRTAASYGFDKEWLLRNVPIARGIQDKSFLSENPTGLAALDQLLKYSSEAEAMPHYLCLAGACKYIAETRSLIWFAVRDGTYNLTNHENIEVLTLLQEEVTAACDCQNNLLYPERASKLSCDGNELNKKVNECVEIIKTSEKKLAQREFYKKTKEVQ